MSGSLDRLTKRRIPDALTKDVDTAQFMQAMIDQIGAGASVSATFQTLPDGFSFAGNGGRSVRVNAGATALEPFDETTSSRFTSAPTAIVASSTVTLAHGLGVTPTRLAAYLVNVTAEFGYVAGDIVSAPTFGGVFTSTGPALFRIGASMQVDATNVTVIFASGSAGNLYFVVDKGTFVSTFANSGNWNIVVIAEP